MEPVHDIQKPKHAYFSISGSPMSYAHIFAEQAEAQGWEVFQFVFESHVQIQNSGISVPGQPQQRVISLYGVILRKRITGDKRPTPPEFVDPAIILRERNDKEGGNGQIKL